MNLESEFVHYTMLLVIIIAFPVRAFFIRKRIIKIYGQLRKKVPLDTHKIDLTVLQPAIKYVSTEQVLQKIESHLSDAKEITQQAK